MMVFSLPRSGATKFCMDLAEKYGMDFVGDTKVDNILEFGASWAKQKVLYHETNFDNTVTIKQYINNMINHKDRVILLNTPELLPVVPFCDKIILRKNVKNMALSLTNYQLKLGTPLSRIENFILPKIFNCAHVLYEYVFTTETDLTWYEDYFSITDTKTTLLDEHANADIIYSLIDISLTELQEKIYERTT